ncbi:MAG: phytanoyl-CoA dioxygenase family protein [Thermoanaerobaculia bacterium]
MEAMTRAANAPPPATALRPDGRLDSDLWLDQPDALERITERERAGELSAAQSANLRHFVERGYLVFRPAISDSLLAAIVSDLDRLWLEQPPYVAFAYHSLLTRFSGHDEGSRKPSCRIADLHAFSDAALALYLEPEIHAYVAWIFGEPAVATQSLTFEWGSQQALHRDPIHVQMARPAHLLAAWIALEDISPDCGPLVYVPGSHRLPYFQFEPGRYVHDHQKDGVDGIRRAQAFDEERCRAAGLTLEPLTCKRGEVLIWHHSLLHGGSYPKDPALTRKSFVVHYSTRANMPQVRNTYLDPYLGAPGDEPAEMIYATTRLLGDERARGFASPLAERFRAEAAAFYRERRELEREIVGLRGEGEALRQRIAAMEASRFWKLRDAWFAAKRAVGWTSGR